MTLWPCTITLLAFLIQCTLALRHALPKPELIAFAFMICATNVAMIGILCRTLLDEARCMILPAAPRPQLLVTGILLMAVVVVPMVAAGIGAGLDPVVVPLGVLAMVVMTLLMSTWFIDVARSATPSQLTGILFGSPFLLLAIPQGRDLLMEPFYPHPAWSPAMHLLCDAPFVLVDLALAGILVRTLRRVLHDEPAQLLSAASPTHPFTHVRTTAPARHPSGPALGALAAVRHAESGMPALPPRLGLGAALAVFTAVLGYCQKATPEGRFHVLAICALAILGVQVATQSMVLTGYDGIRNDVLRPWSRRRWIWQIHGTLAWRNGQVWGAAWCGSLIGLCTYQSPRLSWLLAIALTLLYQPLLLVCQSWMLSLTRSWMAWVHSLAYSAQFAPLYILYRNLDHSLSVTTPWAVGAVLALLVLDGLLILVVLRRWRRVELN